jgi:hypothetical protein
MAYFITRDWFLIFFLKKPEEELLIILLRELGI